LHYISKRNRTALIIVILLSIVIVYIPRVVSAFDNQSSSIQISDAEIQDTRNRISKFRKQRMQFYSEKKNLSNKYKVPPSKFDPNNYSINDWMNLGLSEKQAIVVTKFTSRGIKSNEDLKRVFVISDELFDLIKDSTFYQNSQTISEPKKEVIKETKKPKLLVELNQANIEELMKINGIGESFAKWIINYRTRLGGFHNKNQLLEVWKMDLDKFLMIEPFVEVNEVSIIKIKLNTATVDELKKHPYLNWNIANSIIKIRNKKGSFSSIQEIKESVLIDEECFEKLKPYLSL
jgi:DNA uptake protein ComE-like DNA-binding protein